MKKKILFSAVTFSIPVLIIAAIMFYLVEGPIKDEFVSDHKKEFTQQVNYINYTIQQLETYISNWGNSFEDDIFVRYSDAGQNYQVFDDISKRLFHLENTSPLIENATIAVQSDEPFYVNAGGTWSQMTNNIHPAIELIKPEQTFQWNKRSSLRSVDLYFTQNISDTKSVFLIVSIDLDHLRNMLEVTTGSDSGFAAYFIDGEPIVTTGTIPADMKFSEASDNFIKLDNIEYNLVSISQTRFNHDWAFHSLVPVNSLIQPIQSLSKILVLISLFLIGGTILYSYLLSKRQYKPIYDFIGEITGEKVNEKDSSSSAIDYLKTHWEELQNERNLLVTQTQIHEKRTKRNFINKIIRGEYDFYTEAELLSRMEKSGWHTLRNGYRLYSIQLTGYVNSSDKKTHFSELNGFVLENLVNDLAQKHLCEFAILHQNDHTLYVFCSITLEDDQTDDLFTNDIFKNINTILKRFATITVSENNTEIKLLPSVYEALSYNRLFHRMVNENQLLFPMNDLNDITTGIIYPTNIEEQLINDFRNNHPDKLYTHTNDFINAVISQSDIHIYTIEVVKRLYDTISFFLLENCISQKDFLSKEELINQLDTHFDSESLADELYHSFLEEAFQLYSQSRHDNMRTKIMHLRDYLHQNYTDPNLSLEQSAAELDLEPHVLSKGFKDILNVNYIDYITNLRLEKAKSLLVNSDQKINEIAKHVGYNSSYFNRLFKKKTGLTPGSFRAQEQEKEASTEH